MDRETVYASIVLVVIGVPFAWMSWEFWQLCATIDRIGRGR